MYYKREKGRKEGLFDERVRERDAESLYIYIYIGSFAGDSYGKSGYIYIMLERGKCWNSIDGTHSFLTFFFKGRCDVKARQEF